jgi:hypothetical protein
MLNDDEAKELNMFLIPIVSSEKDGSGKLLPGVKEKIKEGIAAYISYCGCINVRRISRALCVNYTTAKEIIDEVVDEWRESDIDQIHAQIAWVEDQLEQIEVEKKKPSPVMSYSEYINLKTTLMNQLNDLRKLANPGSDNDNEEMVAFHLFGKVKKKTADAMQERIEQNGSTT